MSAGLGERIGRNAAALLGWAWSETGRMLPSGLASIGASHRAALITLDADGAATAPGGAARSLLGRWRHVAKPGRGEAIVLLHPDKVLRRKVRLSALAARDPEAAARLQAATLSPIRPEDAVFAVDAARRDGDGGPVIELAIARRRDVEAASDLAASRAKIWRVAGDFGEDGPAFVFASGKPQRLANPLLMALLAGLAMLAALTALDFRLSRDVEALGAQRAALLAEARASRAAEAAASEQDTPAGRAAGYPLLADVLAATSQAEAETLERVRAIGRRVIMETPDGQVIETEAGDREAAP
jgi:hypothetical protein